MSLPFGWESLGKWSRGLALAAGLGLASAAQAQPTPRPLPSSGGVSKYVVKSATFHLPFKMDRNTLAQVREMHLWMRDAAGLWKLVDRVPPTANFFTCRVPRDGEYGFSIVTIDARGVPSPADVTRRPAELHIIVETQSRPPMTSAIIPASASPVTDVVTLNDSAPTPPPKASKGTSPEIVEPQETLEIPTAPAATTAPPPAAPARPSRTPMRPTPAPPAAMPEALEHQDIQPDDSKTITEGDAAASRPVILLVGKTHVSIEYNVNKAGPSGLSKVVIYGTSDDGQTWRKLGEDSDQQSPAEIDLPGEGLYGIRMVGVNGNGFGGKAPAAGERPASAIEVDVTKPKIHGWKVALAKNGQLEIRWRVTDKNLGNEPITIFYSTRRNGPWKPLAIKLKNDGCYRWSIARDPAPQYFIRLEASDLAGNITACETQTPVLVDRTPPEINVTGVSTIRSSTITESRETLVPVSEKEE
jgi:hypothetical protein